MEVNTKDLIPAMVGIVYAWESLEGNNSYSSRDIENWLSSEMKPAIDRIKEVLKTMEE